MSGLSVKSPLCKAIVIDFFIQYQRKFLITYKKIVYVNLEYKGILKPWKTCDLTTMKHQLKTVWNFICLLIFLMALLKSKKNFACFVVPWMVVLYISISCSIEKGTLLSPEFSNDTTKMLIIRLVQILKKMFYMISYFTC